VITVEAVGQSSSTLNRREVKLTSWEEPQHEKPNLYALSIGISRYSDETLLLNYAHKDALDFAAAWQRFEGRDYGKVIVKTLIDEEANVLNIRGVMQWLSESVRPHKDLAIVFLSGHGLYEKRLGSWYFAAADLDRTQILQTAIGQAELTGWLDNQLACDKIFFADTCHDTQEIQRLRFASRHPLQKDIWRNTNTLVVASCLDDQESVESSDWGNGAFTEAILDALSGRESDYDKDGHLSFKELGVYLERRVPKLAREVGRVQMPATKDRLGVGQLLLGSLGEQPIFNRIAKPVVTGR